MWTFGRQRAVQTARKDRILSRAGLLGMCLGFLMFRMTNCMTTTEFEVTSEGWQKFEYSCTAIACQSELSFTSLVPENSCGPNIDDVVVRKCKSLTSCL